MYEADPPEKNELLHLINPKIIIEKLESFSLIASLRKNKPYLYKDEKFKPEITNLSYLEEKRMSLPNVHWLKSSEIYKENCYLFSGPIKSSHLFHFNFQNVYWLSCVCILSDKGLLKRLFLYNTLNELGFFSIFLNKNGKWKNFIIDDMFPINIEKFLIFFKSKKI